MDTYVLFWRALFGLQAQPVWDLPDPYGLIQSRAMVDPAGTLRLTFNISEARGHGDQPLRLGLRRGRGASRRVCGPDAAQAVAAIQAAGAQTVAIPANYYEDVAARLGLDDGQAAALERLGLLYDRDAGGDFHHAYTAAFQRRFFFEVVERQRGYAGFGAANAAVRMAAQARTMQALV